MNRTAFPLITALLLAPALVLTDRQQGPAAGGDNYVVVDPNDLRPPVPDPEQGLTDKYDGKLVRFTGALRRGTLDKKTKKPTYELQYDFVRLSAVKGKPPKAVRDASIVVPVTFRQDDKQLRARRPGSVITVEGRGHITVDGSLVITDAALAPVAVPTPGVRPGIVPPVPKK
jgi:hypothetical protein